VRSMSPSRPLALAFAALIGTALLGAATTASAQQGAKPAAAAAAPAANSSKKAPVNDPKSQGSYSIGVVMGQQLHALGVNADAVSAEKIVQGLRDALSGKVHASAADEVNMETLIQGARVSAAKPNKEAGQKFLAENGKKPGVVTTASGLQYKVITPGSGASPHPTDTVVVNYRGTLLNGSEFDNSYKRGEPLSIAPNNVVPGWKEALSLMKPGAKWEVYIPSDLGYGDSGAGPIPPGSTLIFTIELLSVKGAQTAPPPPAAAPGK